MSGACRDRRGVVDVLLGYVDWSVLWFTTGSLAELVLAVV